MSKDKQLQLWSGEYEEGKCAASILSAVSAWSGRNGQADRRQCARYATHDFHGTPLCVQHWKIAQGQQFRLE